MAADPESLRSPSADRLTQLKENLRNFRELNFCSASSGNFTGSPIDDAIGHQREKWAHPLPVCLARRTMKNSDQISNSTRMMFY